MFDLFYFNNLLPLDKIIIGCASAIILLAIAIVWLFDRYVQKQYDAFITFVNELGPSPDRVMDMDEHEATIAAYYRFSHMVFILAKAKKVTNNPFYKRWITNNGIYALWDGLPYTSKVRAM